MKLTFCRVAAFLTILALCAAPVRVQAQESEEVELFAAIEAGELEVKLIPRDAKQANVIITNKTNKPLKVRMPDAFAGVPVLAQIGGFGGQGGGFGGQGGGFGGQGGGNQGFGGGFGGQGGGGFGGGQQGGIFNVGPEKVGKIKVATVCLEHGKDDPNPRVAYELKPIAEFTDNQQAIEVCKMLGRGEIDQGSAQAAAWHFTDGLSWEQLANKIGVKHLNGSVEPFFSRIEVTRGFQIAQAAAKRAEAAKANEESIAGKENSLSQN